MLYTVVVTIGRNIGTMPMPSMEWAHFLTAVERALMSRGQLLSFPVTGNDQTGEWEGQHESSAVFVAFVHEQELAYIRDRVTAVRIEYGQEAAGFIAVGGTNHVV
jgi:hypothetical protein